VPVTKLGRLMPMSAMASESESIQVPGRTPPSTPAGVPIRIARMIATTPSWADTGSEPAMISETR
jgi:hypothetical protein